ncbi:MAG: hypothetical protein JW884_11665 [Deltaproteobacteria bacterium]|nr:hypothetical protein [Deltaproteobacteria bacterium]
MTDNKTSGNRLGVKGWFAGGRWGMERYIYAIHRLTGLGLLLFLTIHIFESSMRIYGAPVWERTMAFLDHPLFAAGEFLIIIGFAFHAINGLRLVFLELGFGVGKAIEPVYPYRTSVQVQRPLAIAVMILSALLIAAGGIDLFFIRP